MPPKRKSSTTDSASSPKKRSVSSVGALDDTTQSFVETVQASVAEDGPTDAPVSPEELRKFRSTLDRLLKGDTSSDSSMGVEPQTLANMASRLIQSHSSLSSQLLAQAKTIGTLNERIEHLTTQHAEERAKWDSERFTSSRMTDALLAVARTEEGGVKTRHLERECSRILAENHALQTKYQDAVKRSKHAEEQVQLLRPYAVYMQSVTSGVRQRGGGMGVAIPMPMPMPMHMGMHPSPLPFGAPLSSYAHLASLSPTSPSTASPGPSSAVPKPLPTTSKGAKKALDPSVKKSTAKSSAGTNRAGGSPDSLDDLITAAQRALDSETPTSTSANARSNSTDETQQKERAASRSALDVLVEVAFADTSATKDERSPSAASASDSGSDSGDSPHPPQSRSLPRTSTVAKTARSNNDGAVAVQRKTSGSNASNGKKTNTNTATTNSHSASLPAFMSYAPDYRSIGSTSTSSSSTNGAPKPSASKANVNMASGTGVSPYFMPQAPFGFGLPGYAPIPNATTSTSGFPGGTPYMYRSPVGMPMPMAGAGSKPGHNVASSSRSSSASTAASSPVYQPLAHFAKYANAKKAENESSKTTPFIVSSPRIRKGSTNSTTKPAATTTSSSKRRGKQRAGAMVHATVEEPESEDETELEEEDETVFERRGSGPTSLALARARSRMPNQRLVGLDEDYDGDGDGDDVGGGGGKLEPDPEPPRKRRRAGSMEVEDGDAATSPRIKRVNLVVSSASTTSTTVTIPQNPQTHRTKATSTAPDESASISPSKKTPSKSNILDRAKSTSTSSTGGGGGASQSSPSRPGPPAIAAR